MITTTKKAAEKALAFLKNKNEYVGIRIGVKTTGCSGLAYTLEFSDKITDDDNVYDSNGVKLVVDNKSLVYIFGSVIDYEKNGLNEGFVFRNPNVAGECGCGESFQV